MALSIQDPRATPRNLSDQLRRFVQLSEGPPSANGSSLSDAGFVLLTLKDQILADGPRALHFSQEFIARPLNGIELLSKVVMVLQGIVNTSHGSTSKLSNLLSKNSNSTNRKRKAAVAEADCIECIKILLEKTDTAWRSFLESATGLDAVLHSVHSPQLDSKCYALEILLLLLDQNQGFVIMLRALTALASRNRDYLRLAVFVAQLKHGLHTNKLHIQILVVRLFNKLVASAPSQTHRALVKAEALLAQFSAEYVDKLISGHPGPLGGSDTLIEELSVWKSLNSSANQSYGGSIDHNHIYGLSETESDTAQSDRARRVRGPIGKYPTGNTTVVKNVERQRFKKQGMGSGGRAAAPSYYPSDSTGRHTTSNSFYPPDRRSLTLSNRGWNGTSDTSYSPNTQPRQVSYATERRPHMGGGGMRRAKSESAMVIDDREEMMDSIPRGLKRFDKEQPLYHPIQQTKAMSRSVHDLSMREDPPSSLVRPSSARPSSAAARSLHGTLSPRAMSPTRETLMTDSRASPPRHRYASPTSPRARFAEPPIVEAQHPHAGFSYLFPQQPVLASVVPKRAVTPEPYTRQNTIPRPPSAPLYARAQSPRERIISPSPPAHERESTRPVYTENGQVVYIPINMEGGRRLSKNSRYERRDDYPTESRSSSRNKLRSPSINGEDVRDALSQFDYLNEYDNSSLRGKEREASYHF